ncbi:MAG: NAD(P)/FAD-dependent oxidoreductase [Pyrinomonadaceae bacterium]
MNHEDRDLDVIIIGAGPAGLSAAIWCKDLGLDAVVLEKGPETGGQLLSIYNPITNYPGLRTENGRELRDRFLETAKSYAVDIRLSTEIVHIDKQNLTAVTADGTGLSARSIIVATGVRRRRLNIPGEIELAGKGIIESGSRDKELVRGKTVAIIGGGDAALENALILSEYASKIYVIHRRNEFSARKEFVDRAAAIPATEFILNAEVVRIIGEERVEALEFIDRETKGHGTVLVDAVLLRIGVEPNSGLISDSSDLGPAGYVSTRPSGEPGIYAAGDVANRIAPTIAAAAGTGSSAAKAIARALLVAAE